MFSEKLNCRPLLLYWGNFYDHIRVPYAFKPPNTQFQGSETNFNFFEKSRVDCQEYIVRILISIFVFLKSKNPMKPNFKVKGPILKIRKNRRVGPQVDVVAGFWCQIHVQQVLKPSDRDFGAFYSKRWKPKMKKCASVVCCHNESNAKNVWKSV